MIARIPEIRRPAHAAQREENPGEQEREKGRGIQFAVRAIEPSNAGSETGVGIIINIPQSRMMTDDDVAGCLPGCGKHGLGDDHASSFLPSLLSFFS